MATINTKAIKPLGVSRYGESVAMVGTLAFSGKQKLRIASGEPLGELKFDQEELVVVLPLGKLENPAAMTAFQLSTVAQQHIATYSVAEGKKQNVRIATRVEDDGLVGWEVASINAHLTGRGQIVPEYRHAGQYALIHGEGELGIAFSKNLVAWSKTMPLIKSRPHYYDHGALELIGVSYIEQGILVFYQTRSNHRDTYQLQMGGILLAKDNPMHVLWRAETPLWESGKYSKKREHRLVGAYALDDLLVAYELSGANQLITHTMPNPFDLEPMARPEMRLARHEANPIMSPRENDWESVGVFNPAVFQHDGKIHMLYRALNYAGMSMLGYASSTDGYTIDYRSQTPAYWPREQFEGVNAVKTSTYSDAFASGGGWGGCEDPKLAMIDEIVYLTYVAHDGYGPPRVAMSTMHIDDFVAKRWHKWSKATLISEPGIVNKSGVLLPEKINGKFVVFHRVFPNILIHYDDTLDLGEHTDKWLETHGEIAIRPHAWDSRKLSVGATPIRIKEGWLVIYHAVDDRDDAKYKIGAMILDADDPSKVLYRTNSPILAPEEYYENEWKFGIAYPSGAAVKDGTLFVYYGGGDKFVCVATANLEQFIDELMKEKPLKLVSSRTKVKHV